MTIRTLKEALVHRNKSMQAESHDDWDDEDFDDDQRESDDPAHKISPHTINKYGRGHIEHDGVKDVTKPGATTPTHEFKNPHPKGSPKHKNFGKDLQDGLTDAGAEPYKVTQHPTTGHATVEYTNNSLTGNPDIREDVVNEVSSEWVGHKTADIPMWGSKRGEPHVNRAMNLRKAAAAKEKSQNLDNSPETRDKAKDQRKKALGPDAKKLRNKALKGYWPIKDLRAEADAAYKHQTRSTFPFFKKG